MPAYDFEGEVEENDSNYAPIARDGGLNQGGTPEAVPAGGVGLAVGAGGVGLAVGGPVLRAGAPNPACMPGCATDNPTLYQCCDCRPALITKSGWVLSSHYGAAVAGCIFAFVCFALLLALTIILGIDDDTSTNFWLALSALIANTIGLILSCVGTYYMWRWIRHARCYSTMPTCGQGNRLPVATLQSAFPYSDFMMPAAEPLE